LSAAGDSVARPPVAAAVGEGAPELTPPPRPLALPRQATEGVISRIAYVFAQANQPLYWPTGHSIHVRAICRALREIGHDVFILAALKGNDEGDPDAPRVHELAPRIASLRSSRGSSSAPSRAPRPPTETRASASTSLNPRSIAYDIARTIWWRTWDNYFYRRARSAILDERPDFLYERYVRGGSAGARLAREFDLPYILEINTSFTFPSEWWSEHSPLFPWQIARMERRLTSAADRVIVVSSHLRDYFLAAGVPREKLVVMLNAADIHRFDVDPSEGRRVRIMHNLQDAIVVGFVGSLKPWHGLDMLIRGFRRCTTQYPTLRLLIVGDGPLRNSLEALATEEVGLDHVIFAGAVRHADIPAYLSAMDIAVCPAPTVPSYHLSPIKLFEYMAAGRPVIAARFSDVPTVVKDHENGVLVGPGDDAELADAILELTRDAELRVRLGRAAYHTIKSSYTWQRNAETSMELFEQIAREKRRAW
jgi:glycosyltransferase involved in cell wall biosynthesis